MKKFGNIIPGALFFIVVSAIILLAKVNSPLLFPSQEVLPASSLKYGSLMKGFVFVQEITLKKDYLNAVEFVLYTSNRRVANHNQIVILNSHFRVLHRDRFTNIGLQNATKTVYRLPRSIFVGKGSKIYVCFASPDGDKNSSLLLIRNPEAKPDGYTYAKKILKNDIITSVRTDSERFAAKGSLAYKVYESNVNSGLVFRVFLLFLVLLVSLAIIYSGPVKAFILRTTLRADRIFVIIGLLFGSLFLYVSPPLQTPDENTHFYRAYQVSELHLFKYDPTVPASLPRLSDRFSPLYFNSHAKTTRAETAERGSIPLEPDIRVEQKTADYIIPFIPQAIGISIARMLNLSPLWFIYLGSIANLLASLFLIMLAIRIIPTGKWLLFMLALMPMAVNQFASLSYDALTISLSFLLIAIIFRYVTREDEVLSRKQWAILILVAVLQALCKPPYMLLALLAVTIPIAKAGGIKKYIFYLTLLFVLVFAASRFWVLRNAFEPDAKTSVSAVVAVKDNMPDQTVKLDSVNIKSSGSTGQKEPGDKSKSSTTEFDPAKPNQGVDANAQQKYVLENPWNFLSVVITSIDYFGDFYLDAFVGKLGWLVTSLPKWFVPFYLIVLLLTVMCYPAGIAFGWKERLLFLGIFVVGFLLIELVMYIGWTPYQCRWVEGVQGRYFIPLAPVLFLMLSNKIIGPRVDMFFTHREKVIEKKKGKGKKKQRIKPVTAEPVFTMLLPYLFILTTIIGMLVTVFILVNRFYKVYM